MHHFGGHFDARLLDLLLLLTKVVEDELKEALEVLSVDTDREDRLEIEWTRNFPEFSFRWRLCWRLLFCHSVVLFLQIKY